jgi:transposase
VTTRKNGGDDACLQYSCCLTDEQWRLIEPLLPIARRGRPRLHPLRRVLDTIWYVLRTGCAWRLVPHDLVPWHAAYRCFRSWTQQGVWADIHDALRDAVRTATGRNPAPTAAVLDSQTVQSSEGGEQIGWDQGKKTRGRKRHLLVDTNGLLLICHVHSAADNDRTGAKLVLGWLDEQYPTIELIWLDGGYANAVDDHLIGWADKRIGVKLQVVKRSDDVKGFQVLPRRWVVERTLGWIDRYRRLARDFERLTAHAEAMVHIAMTGLMLRRLTGQETRYHNLNRRQATQTSS